MTMVSLEKLYISYFMIESFKVTLRKETVDKQIERVAKVMLSDIVMDNEETGISMDGVLSIFAGCGGLGWKLYEERQLDYPPSEKAASVATYARVACRQVFPNIKKGEADKMAAALLALLAWLVDHLPKASDTELAMHLFGQASHISPKYFAEHLPYTLLKPYENMAEEMAGWLLNYAVAAETLPMPSELTDTPQSEFERFLEIAIKENDEDTLKAYKSAIEKMLLAEENKKHRELLRLIKVALAEMNRPGPTILYKSNYNEHVDSQTNMGLSSQQSVYNPSATA